MLAEESRERERFAYRFRSSVPSRTILHSIGNPCSHPQDGLNVSGHVGAYAVSITLEAATLEAIAQRAAELAVAQLHDRDEWLTLPQAAKYIGRSEKALRHLCSRDAIPYSKAGGRLIFNRNDLDKWLRGENDPSPNGRAAP